MLILLIGMTLFATTRVKLTNSLPYENISKKELEFFDTTFIEVDQQTMLAYAFGSHGIREEGVLFLENIRYFTHNIEELVANRGKLEKNVLYLDGNVILREKEGNLYHAEHAIYHQKTEILEIPSLFTAKNNENIFQGNSLHYNAKTKELNASKIAAVFYTSKKQ